MRKLFVILILSTFYLYGCVQSNSESQVEPKTKTVTTKNPDAEETLRLNENADIFQWDGLIYQTGITWVDDLQLTKNELVGEITSIFEDDPKSFKNGMANQLPLGTKIYSTKEQGILIVEHDGKTKYYLALVEG
ncbi:hypothetical protein ACFYKX_08400 [Cytobacillus sp. FJAT-54145]|uniref:Lipoprotein n=1 Tax=Cytobacillus spartinae TaxID=3299023 RepID=A0ABW6K8V7_9BACI